MKRERGYVDGISGVLLVGCLVAFLFAFFYWSQNVATGTPEPGRPVEVQQPAEQERFDVDALKSGAVVVVWVMVGVGVVILLVVGAVVVVQHKERKAWTDATEQYEIATEKYAQTLAHYKTEFPSKTKPKIESSFGKRGG